MTRFRHLGHLRDHRGRRVRHSLVKASPSNPFEMFLMVVCVLNGFVLTFNIAGREGSVTSRLDPPAATIWGAALLLGGMVCIVGILWRNRVTGVVLEQIGLVTVGSACIFYVTALLLFFGWAATFPIGITVAFAASCFVRWGQLQKELSLLRHIVSGDLVVEP